MGIGEQIRKRRKELNLTRNALAEEIHVTPSAIANYENSISYPKPEIFLSLMDALHIDANYLFSDSINSDIARTLTSDRSLTDHESQVLEHYFALPDRIRKMIDTMIETEYQTYRTSLLPVYTLGNHLSEPKNMRAESLQLPPSTDFCVQLETDHYLPFYRNYDILAFCSRNPMNNEIGLFKIHSDYALKIVKMKNKDIILSSFDPSEDDLLFHNSDDICCLGVLLDKLYGQCKIQ